MKRPEREVNHSSPSTAEVNNEWSFASTAVWFHGVHWGNLTFTVALILVLCYKIFKHFDDKLSSVKSVEGGCSPCVRQSFL